MKSINNNIVALGWVSFFTDMASAMLVPIIPIFVVTVLNDGADTLGVILAISSFISYFLRYFTGYIAEKYRVVKPLMIIGYSISALCKPLFFLSHSWQSVASLRATERLGKSIRSAPKDLLISHFSPKRKSGQNFGFHKMMDIAGELSGTLLIFILFYFYSSSEILIRQIFLFTAIPGSISVFIMIFFVGDIKYQSTPQSSEPLSKEDHLLKIPLLFFFGFTFFIFEESFFILRSQELGFSLTLIPLLLVTSKLTQTLVSYKIGLLIDKYQHAKMMAVSYVIGALSMFLFASGLTILNWFGFALYGIYTVSSLTLIRAMISEQASNKGHIYGLFYAGMAIAIALGSLFFGYIWENYNGQVALIISMLGSLTLIALYFIHLLLPKNKSR